MEDLRVEVGEVGHHEHEDGLDHADLTRQSGKGEREEEDNVSSGDGTKQLNTTLSTPCSTWR